MFKMSIKPEWHLLEAESGELLPRLVDLLIAVHANGQLAEACRQLGLSYRYAWGLLREGNRAFGTPLVTMTRGRGASLTSLGEKLVWADKRIAARLAPLLDSLASELEVEIEKTLSDSRAILRINASHGFAVETLREFMVQQQVPVEVKYRGSHEAVASLVNKSCDMAGFHVPLGVFEKPAIELYAQWLNPVSQRVVNLATRRQGIMVANGNPKHIRSIEDLARPDVRFVNRQPGSGTRMLLDLLLESESISGSDIDGYDTSEFTHAAVAAFIASGMADAGLGVETPAKRFDLDFIPLVKERYFFLCSTESLQLPAVSRAIEIMRSADFRSAVDQLPGYEATMSGVIQDIADAFPDFRPVRRRGRKTAART